MGTKRKASLFEDDTFTTQQNPRSTTPSLASSSPSSTTTTQSSSDAPSFDSYRVKAIPYLSTRTRKRHRGDRPEAEIIHENTLKKLYDAQRLHLDEAMSMSDVMVPGEQGVPMDEDANMVDDTPEAEIPQQIEGDQRSLEAFFGGKVASSQGRDAATSHTPVGQQQGFWTDFGT